MNEQYINIDGKDILIEGERNLLEVIRKADIELPTFCYHSDLSIYGACRLCLVEVEKQGLVSACSQAPINGMKVRTNTDEIRDLRKIYVELLMASHVEGCMTCSKNETCKLLALSRRLSIEEVRFESTTKKTPRDLSTPSLVRDPDKCVLCGDCVRMCKEVQGIGAIDFAYRGSKCMVLPAFNKDLSHVECVYCGQCAAVCPTGAIIPRSHIEKVWKAIHDPKKHVVVQIAPAVRVAIGEEFGLEAGTLNIGQLVAALKKIGVDRVFDTSFAADLTVMEEGNEFLKRYQKGEKLPQFTSCCPAWVKFAEQYYPEFLPNLSSCRSPQQMFGSIAKETLPQVYGVKREDMVVVAIMPCTAKKFEAERDEFKTQGIQDVDFVLTTQEVARMIAESGIKFSKLAPESLDMPFGFKTGAGLIFGTTGGVTEAALRYAFEQISDKKLDNYDFHQVRGNKGIKEAVVTIGDVELKIAIVNGLANAKEVAEDIKAGRKHFDFIEVMACPGGCVAGAGQPVCDDLDAKAKRRDALYTGAKSLQLHKSQDNPYIVETYKNVLGEVGSPKAHHLLHTEYQNRKRINDSGMPIIEGVEGKKVCVNVCVGTNCYLKGSQGLLKSVVKHVEENNLTGMVDVKATFCLERCGTSPNVMVGDTLIEAAKPDSIINEMKKQLTGFEVTA